MSFMHEETAPTTVTQQIWPAVIASDAQDTLDPVDVIIPSIDPSTRWEDCPWQPRDNIALPQRGDDCVVMIDDDTKVTVVAWWPPTRSPSMSQSPLSGGPPSNPVNGDMWFATSLVSEYVWQFMYEEGWTKDPYKWKFTGGSEAYQQIPTQQTRPGSSPIGDLATVGPTLPIARPGVFHVRWGSLMNTGGSSSGGYAGSVIANQSGTRKSAYEADSGSTSNAWVSAMTEEEMELDATNTSIKMQYFNNANQTATFGNRWLSVVPMRVS